MILKLAFLALLGIAAWRDVKNDGDIPDLLCWLAVILGLVSFVLAPTLQSFLIAIASLIICLVLFWIKQMGDAEIHILPSLALVAPDGFFAIICIMFFLVACSGAIQILTRKSWSFKRGEYEIKYQPFIPYIFIAYLIWLITAWKMELPCDRQLIVAIAFMCAFVIGILIAHLFKKRGGKKCLNGLFSQSQSCIKAQ